MTAQTTQTDRYWDVHHCAWLQHQRQEAATPEAPVPEPREAPVEDAEVPARV